VVRDDQRLTCSLLAGYSIWADSSFDMERVSRAEVAQGISKE
jgi:hypothetical protein